MAVRGRTEALRADLDALCAWTRKPCSAEEAAAADWLAGRLREEGCDSVEIRPAWGFPSYAGPLALLAAAATAAGLMAWRRPRSLPARLLALAAAALVVDDVENGPRLWRRALRRRRQTQNVVATIGPDGAATTLVVLAHHDAAPTGLLFDQRLTRAILARTGGEARSLPFWWPGIAGPVLVAAGAARTGTVMNALGTLVLLDIARDRTVPGANDNGSAVVALIALARRLRERPPPAGVRVVLASCGAEESLQGGIHDLVRELRGDELVLNLDTVGARRLFMAEGEGEFWMEDYAGAPFRDRVAAAAEAAGVRLERGRRLWVSTDSVVPSRAGHPTATLMAVDELGMLPHYHLPSDMPENVDLRGVEAAVDVAEQLIRDLAP
jgi:hypothetical protein